MSENNPHQAGRHFLQIPGPSNVPDRVLRAIAQPTIDHRGPEFAQLTLGVLDKLGAVFNTKSPIFIFPASGTGGWESSLLNTLCPGDKVLAFETGHFATLWKNVATKLGLEVIWVEGDWRQGIDAAVVQQHLLEDQSHKLRQCWRCIQKPPVARPAISPKSGRPSMRSTTLPCSWWMQCPL